MSLPVVKYIYAEEDPYLPCLMSIAQLFDVELRCSRETNERDENKQTDALGCIVNPRALSGMLDTKLKRKTQDTRSGPWFVYGCNKKTLAKLALALDMDIPEPELHETKRYRFLENAEFLSFFSGHQLEEQNRRVITIQPLAGAIRSFIETERGAVFGILEGRDLEVYFSGVDLPPAEAVIPFRNYFHARNFLSLLPIFLFLRRILKGIELNLPKPRACFIIDDPNLRTMSYGYLNFPEMIRSARKHRYHWAVGMIPIDYRTTSRRVADLLTASSDVFSLVMHGNDHLAKEMARDVSEAEQRFILMQALKRMEDHRVRTRIDFPRAMILPHGVCSLQGIESMRTCGCSALVSSHAYPFLSSEETPHNLYQMWPAEMTLRGFPIINRFKEEWDRNDLLFYAWLGKPLLIYGHNQWLRYGPGPLEEIAYFLNRRGPFSWISVKEIIESNYFCRREGSSFQIRLFSNEVRVDIPKGVRCIKIQKKGLDIPWKEEGVFVNQNLLQWSTKESEESTVTLDWAGKPCSLAIRYRPLSIPLVQGWHRTKWRSRCRRLMMEARDRLLPLTRP